MSHKIGIILLLSTVLVISEAYLWSDSSESTESGEDASRSIPNLSFLPNVNEDNSVLKEVSQQLRKIKELEMILLNRYPELRDVMGSRSKRPRRDVGSPDVPVHLTPGQESMCIGRCNPVKGERGTRGFPGYPGLPGHSGLTRIQVENYVRQNAEKLCYEYCPRGQNHQPEIEREGITTPKHEGQK